MSTTDPRLQALTDFVAGSTVAIISPQQNGLYTISLVEVPGDDWRNVQDIDILNDVRVDLRRPIIEYLAHKNQKTVGFILTERQRRKGNGFSAEFVQLRERTLEPRTRNNKDVTQPYNPI